MITEHKLRLFMQQGELSKKRYSDLKLLSSPNTFIKYYINMKLFVEHITLRSSTSHFVL